MSLERICFDFYRRVQPTLAPGLKYSQTLYEDVLVAEVGQDVTWMDLGCGHQMLPPWRFESEQKLAQRAKMLAGLDYDFASLAKHRTIHHRVHGDVTKLPFADGSFDLVTANMVFEHLMEPQVQLAEITRVLRPGGQLIFHTPNALGYGVLLGRLVPGWVKKRLAWFLQGRKAEDVYPAYYRINSSATIESLAEHSGLKVKDIMLVMSSPNLVMIPPLMIVELLLARLLMTQPLRPLRTNIIAILRKPENA